MDSPQFSPLSTILILLVLAVCSTTHAALPRNVLFLAVDDLRVEFSFTGSHTLTPNLDRLAARSLFLGAHHCQYPLCNPSRTSLLTSRRPETTMVHDNYVYWRRDVFNFTTLPELLKDQHGFLTLNFGKIFHPETVIREDYPHSWSRPSEQPADHWGKDLSWREISPEDQARLPLTDDLTAESVVRTIRDELRGLDRRFFLAVGFNKPHLPLYAPARHYAPYPAPEDTDLPGNPYIPEGMPEVAWHNYGNELFDYTDITELGVTGEFNTSLPDFKVRELRRAYSASVSYADEQVGRVLAALEEAGLLNSTMVVVWGDHGWHLGEHLFWLKQVLYERVTRSPTFIYVPGLTDRADAAKATSTFTEHVDLFPTILEALGLPAVPVCSASSRQERLCTEGLSLLPLVTSPERPLKTKVFTNYRRPVGDRYYMGVGLRVDSFRLVEWPLWDPVKGEPDWDVQSGQELYDHIRDPEENVNVHGHPEYASVVEDLTRILRAGWRG